MTHLDEAERAIQRRARTTEGLDLFAQRVAHPEVQMPGAGQLARREARERSHAKRDATYARLAQCLEAHGPLTRKELAEVSGVPVNTVNARISEMRAFLPMGEDPMTWPYAVLTNGRRNGESIVHLARLYRLTEEG